LIAFSTTRSRLVLLEGVLLALSVASCGGSAATPTASPTPSGVQHASLTFDGLKHTYRLYVPPSLDLKQPAPLVVLLHWAGGSADEMAAVTRYDDQAAKRKFIVVYPKASGLAWDAATGDTAIDINFISRLLDQMTTDFRIDQTRIFVAGVSSGAMMAHRLACQLSERIAAIASVAGALLIDDCSPARPVSILAMHGTEDPVVSYRGDSNFPSTESTIRRWVTLNRCADQPKQTTSGITRTSAWTGCRGGTVVRLDTVVGGQHSWFSSDPARVGHGDAGSKTVAGEPDATQGTWDFFTNLAPRT
jgi:polyhydroxybutyrate depolymerase